MIAKDLELLVQFADSRLQVYSKYPKGAEERFSFGH